MSANGSGDGPEVETMRSVEVPVGTAGDRAWQKWRAQIADAKAAIDEWRAELAASTARLEAESARLQAEADQRLAEARRREAEARERYERLCDAYAVDSAARAWRRVTPPERRLQ